MPPILIYEVDLENERYATRMGDVDVRPFARQLVFQGRRKGKDIEALCRYQPFRHDGVSIGNLEGEVKIFGLVGFVEQRFGNERAITIVGDESYRCEALVVQALVFQGAFQGSEKVVAVGQQVRLVAFQGDERLGFGIEKGKRKTTQRALDGHSVMR